MDGLEPSTLYARASEARSFTAAGAASQVDASSPDAQFSLDAIPPIIDEGHLRMGSWAPCSEHEVF